MVSLLIWNPRPVLITTQVSPELPKLHWKGPLVTRSPYLSVGVPRPGLPTLHIAGPALQISSGPLGRR